MWAAIAAKNKEETPPPGAMSAREYADKFDLPLVTAKLQLTRLTNARLMTSTLVKRRLGGKLYTVTYYKPRVG
jgi:hypothetical protein